MTQPHTTFFDTPERNSQSEILEEILLFKENSVINQLLEGYPEVAVILNKNRQIVAFNSKALNKFKSDDYFDIVGNRFGEAINCIHHAETNDGCGTSLFCRECGAGKALKESREKGISTEEECRITTKSGDIEISHNYHVYSRLIKIDLTDYTIFTLRDISNEKRREALEKIFFHDVLNTASAIKGLSEILSEADSEAERIELNDALNGSARQLVNEIQAQRELRNAEDGHLQPELTLIPVNEILVSLQAAYKNHELSLGKLFQFIKTDDGLCVTSDFSLLIRCMGNLIKNALEASAKNEKIVVSASADVTGINFNVFNEKVIPETVQLQLFQRSFSTKKMKGRGLGLYSVKLIVEQYLNGKVSFSSNEAEGTNFTIHLPSDRAGGS